MTELQDPTPVEPEVGQIYEEARSDELYQILYVDEEVVLLRSEFESERGDHYHRMEPRPQFNAQVEADRFTHQPDSDLDLITVSGADWEEVDYIGESTAENLHDAGYNTVIDIRQTGDAALLTVDGLGVKGLDNLRSFAQ